jgi:hypothetical protein
MDWNFSTIAKKYTIERFHLVIKICYLYDTLVSSSDKILSVSRYLNALQKHGILEYFYRIREKKIICQQ